jgi:hypothetical protein
MKVLKGATQIAPFFYSCAADVAVVCAGRQRIPGIGLCEEFPVSHHDQGAT